MTGNTHNTDAHSRPSTGSAAEGARTPALASGLRPRGRATSSRSSEGQPCPETPKGRLDPLQLDEGLAADAAKGEIFPLIQPAEGQSSAAAGQGAVSPSVASIQHGRCPLQTDHKAVAGRPGRSQSNKSTSMASTTPAAGFAPPAGGASTRTKHAATRKARSSMSSKVSSAGKALRQVGIEPKTQMVHGPLPALCIHLQLQSKMTRQSQALQQ